MPLGDDLAEAFHRAHEERYGYVDRDRPIELVAVRTAEIRPGPSHRAAAGRPAQEAAGPAVLELDGATCWLPLGGWGLGMVPRWRLTRT